MQIKIINDPYDLSNLEGKVFDAERNIHGAYAVKVEEIYSTGCDRVFGINKFVFFPDKCVEVLPTRESLENALHESQTASAKFYRWYLDSCAEVEKLKEELAHERGKNSSSDTV